MADKKGSNSQEKKQKRNPSVHNDQLGENAGEGRLMKTQSEGKKKK